MEGLIVTVLVLFKCYFPCMNKWNYLIYKNDWLFVRLRVIILEIIYTTFAYLLHTRKLVMLNVSSIQYCEDSISRKFCNNKAWDEKHYKRTRATTQPCGLQHRGENIKSHRL